MAGGASSWPNQWKMPKESRTNETALQLTYGQVAWPLWHSQSVTPYTIHIHIHIPSAGIIIHHNTQRGIKKGVWRRHYAHTQGAKHASRDTLPRLQHHSTCMPSKQQRR